MKILYSGIDVRKESCGLQRVGHHISHLEYKSRSFNLILGRDVNYFELDSQLVCYETLIYMNATSFRNLHISGDICYIAHYFPCTYSYLKDDLEYLPRTCSHDVFHREILCES